MKKIILPIVLFGAITNVHAEMVAPGVEMVSHHTWTTGNTSGHVEDSSDIFFSSASALASVSSFYGKIYQNIQCSIILPLCTTIFIKPPSLRAAGEAIQWLKFILL